MCHEYSSRETEEAFVGMWCHGEQSIFLAVCFRLFFSSAYGIPCAACRCVILRVKPSYMLRVGGWGSTPPGRLDFTIKGQVTIFGRHHPTFDPSICGTPTFLEKKAVSANQDRLLIDRVALFVLWSMKKPSIGACFSSAANMHFLPQNHRTAP